MKFTCIGFNFIRTSKEKQKVILQVTISSVKLMSSSGIFSFGYVYAEKSITPIRLCMDGIVNCCLYTIILPLPFTA